jgi:hypothetical protein
MAAEAGCRERNEKRGKRDAEEQPRVFGAVTERHFQCDQVYCTSPLHKRVTNARLLGQLASHHDQQDHHHYANHRPNPRTSGLSTYSSSRLYESS